MKPEKGRFRLIASVPGAAQIEPLIAEFSRRPGTVTALSDRLLSMIKRFTSYGELEFVTFAEVVGRQLAISGADRKPLASQGLLIESIAAACQELPDESVFRRSSRFSGTQRAILRSLQELHDAGVPVSTLTQSDDGKLRELAELDSLSRAKIESLGRTTLNELIRACPEGTPEGPALRLIVFAGSRPARRSIAWLHWAASRGADITIVVEQHAAGAGLFEESTSILSNFSAEPPSAERRCRLSKQLVQREKR